MSTNDPMNTAVALLVAELGGMVVDGCPEAACEACQPSLDLAA